MNPKEKTLILILALVVLNLAFQFGQIFYYSGKTASILAQPPKPSNNDLSANLLNALHQKFTLLIDGKELPIDQSEFSKWVEEYTRSYRGDQEYRVSQKNIQVFLEYLSKEIDIPMINAQIAEITAKGITESAPAQAGYILDIPGTLSSITSVLATKLPVMGLFKSKVTMINVPPQVSLDKINSLGINRLIGHGESSFAGSSKARVTNIQIGAKIFNNILVGPGQELSFDKMLGPVDINGGYQSEHVIKGGKVILEYGGGICQVSTTLFRAAIMSGFPILERHAHSLPVIYYDPQGFDATIYPGSADLRFKNDTKSSILIQSKISGSKIYFNVYGTDDGRKVSIDGPHQKVNPDNSIQADFSRTITYSDGTKKEDVFLSSYLPNSLYPIVRNPLE